MQIQIENEIIDIEKVELIDSLALISEKSNKKYGGREWYLSPDLETASKHVREYWEDMAENDPDEFGCIIGERRLIKWGLHQDDEFGISSMDEFFDNITEVPEEHLASYDGEEIVLVHNFDTIEGIKDYIEELEADIVEGVMKYEEEVVEEELSVEDEPLLAYYKEFLELCEECNFVPKLAYRCN